jgi:uncharacterized membrane protein
MLKYPQASLNCDINPIVDCGGVLGDKLSAVFGPPNAFIGMVLFAMLFAFGLQRLHGTWTKLTSFIVVTLSKILFLFSAWFFSVSLYSLGKICIFCIFIWFVSVPIAVYGVKDYLENKKALNSYQESAKRFMIKHHFTIVVTLYATMITLYLLRFREYYFS